MNYGPPKFRYSENFVHACRPLAEAFEDPIHPTPPQLKFITSTFYPDNTYKYLKEHFSY